MTQNKLKLLFVSENYCSDIPYKECPIIDWESDVLYYTNSIDPDLFTFFKENPEEIIPMKKHIIAFLLQNQGFGDDDRKEEVLIIKNFPNTQEELLFLSNSNYPLHVLTNLKMQGVDNISSEATSDLHFSYGFKIFFADPSTKPLESEFIKSTSPLNRCIMIQKCLMLSQSIKQGKLFPGTHPVNITLNNIHLLKDYPYFLSLKIDGTRYMMFISSKYQKIFIMNRKLEVFELQHNLKIPHSANNSLFDVEIKDHTVTIIDVIAINNRCIRGEGISKRLQTAQNNSFFNNFQFQQYHKFSELPKLLHHFKKHTEFDGIIFTPCASSYRLGRNTMLLKWKPNSKNTADFLLKKTTNSSTVYEIYSQLSKETQKIDPTKPFGLRFEGFVVTPPNSNIDGKIAECSYILDKEAWKFEKVRYDKENPNPDWVVQNIILSIHQNITEETLQKICQPLS